MSVIDRPAIGTKTTRIINALVCRMCGCMVYESGLCSDDCSQDTEERTNQNTFVAVYERVNTFMGDKDYVQ